MDRFEITDCDSKIEVKLEVTICDQFPGLVDE